MTYAALRKFGALLFLTALSVTAILTLAAFGARAWWLFDLCTHFRAHYLAVLTLGTLICVLIRQFRAVIVFAAFALANLWFVGPLFIPATIEITNGVPIRLMTVNALRRNSDHRKLLDLINRVRPDALLVMEVNHPWASSLEELAPPIRTELFIKEMMAGESHFSADCRASRLKFARSGPLNCHLFSRKWKPTMVACLTLSVLTPLRQSALITLRFATVSSLRSAKKLPLWTDWSL